MSDAVAQPPLHSSARVLVSFLLHQIISTIGVAIMAPLAVIVFADIVRIFGVSLYSSDLHKIITETPYFPVQVLLALFLGWLIGRFVRQRSALWVWVLPLAILSWFVVAFPSVGQIGVPQHAVLRSPDRWSHYFRWGCRARHACIDLDQLVVTMPFYSATVYSLGAWIARKMGPALNFTQYIGNINKRRAALFVGVPSLCVTLASVWIGLCERNAHQTVLGACALLAWALAESVIVTFLVVTVLSLMGSKPRLAGFFLVSANQVTSNQGAHRVP